MRQLRVVVLLAIVAVVAFVAYRAFAPTPPAAAGAVTVSYAKTDGLTLGRWTVTLGPARDRASVAFYAAVQCVAGPPASVEAIRFPTGTRVDHVTLDGGAATVDLGGSVAGDHHDGSAFVESAEFKALVWTLTDLPGVSSVRVLINGNRVATLPGGHLELDQPLSRSNWN